MTKSTAQKNTTLYKTPFSPAFWREATGEIKSLRTLAIAAIIVAIRVALKELYIPVGEDISIYIGFIFTAVGGAVYGPVMALLVGTATDILGFIVAPKGAFNPLFTLVEVLATFLYALCVYRQKITFGRILLSKALVNVLANMVLQSFVMSLVYGKAMYIYVVPRILKNAVMLPFEVLILVLVFSALLRPMISVKLLSPAQNALRMKASAYVILGITMIVVLAGALFVVLNYDAVLTAFKGMFGM